MTPDKIYCWKGTLGSFYASPQKQKEIKTEEYIRKDALMKIIETARESAIIQRNFNNCPVEQEARIDAYDYIKHKIESL